MKAIFLWLKDFRPLCKANLSMLVTFSKLSWSTMLSTEAKAKSQLNLSRSCSLPCKLCMLLSSQFLRIGSPNRPKLSTLDKLMILKRMLLILWPLSSNTGSKIRCTIYSNLNSRCHSRCHSICHSRCHSRCHSKCRCNSRCHSRCNNHKSSMRCNLNTRPHLSRAPWSERSKFHYFKEKSKILVQMFKISAFTSQSELITHRQFHGT